MQVNNSEIFKLFENLAVTSKSVQILIAVVEVLILNFSKKVEKLLKWLVENTVRQYDYHFIDVFIKISEIFRKEL